MTLIRGLRGIWLVPMASLTLLFVNGAYAQAILGFGFGETLWEHLWTIAAKTYFGRYLILAFFSSLITSMLLGKFIRENQPIYKIVVDREEVQ